MDGNPSHRNMTDPKVRDLVRNFLSRCDAHKSPETAIHMVTGGMITLTVGTAFSCRTYSLLARTSFSIIFTSAHRSAYVSAFLCALALFRMQSDGIGLDISHVFRNPRFAHNSLSRSLSTRFGGERKV